MKMSIYWGNIPLGCGGSTFLGAGTGTCFSGTGFFGTSGTWKHSFKTLQITITVLQMSMTKRKPRIWLQSSKTFHSTLNV